MSEKTQSKKITFTEEVDSKINGIALVLTFLGIGVFLIVYPQYFGNTIAAQIVQWIFILIGILGLISEVNKSNKSSIKGIDNFIIGIILLGGWAILFILWNLWYINILSLLLLVFGLYGIVRGIIEMIYSKKYRKKKKDINQVNQILFC